MDAGVSPKRGSGIRPAYRVYALLLAAGVVATLPASVREAAGMPWETALWIVVVAASNLLTLPMAAKVNLDVTLGAPVSVAAAVVLPIPLVVLVNVVGFVHPREWRSDTSFWVIVFNRTQLGLCAGAASLAATQVPWGPLVATVAAALVYNFANATALAIHVRLRRQLQLVEAAKSSAVPFPHFMVDFGVVTLLAVLVVAAYDQVGPLAVLLLALPLWLGYSALRSARTAEDRAEQLDVRVRELETLHALGTQLLGVRSSDAAVDVTHRALAQALDTQDVEIVMDGKASEGLQEVAIPGAEPAVIGVSEADEATLAVVEAIAGLLGMALQRVRLERELGEVERARTALSGRILEEGTKERSRIALQIHDDVLPYLAAAEIQADNVRSALHGRDRDRADALAGATRQAVHDGIGRLREVLDALRRQTIAPGGLMPAMDEALEELRLRQGVSGSMTVRSPLPPLPLAVEILVLETVRGCLTNVARHAKAESVTVELDIADGRVMVEVADDGRGFDPTTVAAGHQGLALMAQRVELARGSFRVCSAPGSGTAVQVEVPL